jgi:three-Cys-motif partner protein
MNAIPAQVFPFVRFTCNAMVHRIMPIEAEFIDDDGLKCNDVGGWTEEKYRLIASYFKQFSTGTKNTWPHRTFIDLYSGAGYSRLRSTGKILKGSPILALSVKDLFDQYVLCEENPENFQALKTRIDRDFSTKNVKCIFGDCNQRIDEIINLLPRRDSLGLCFVDPYNLSIKFETLKKLAERRLDILCLLALHMDANRAYDVYINQDSSKVDLFLGSNTWKADFANSGRSRQEFPNFLATYFAKRMQTLGFEETPTHSMHLVRSDDRNVPLYHLALFSRNQLAYKFWDQARTYSTDQRKLW